MTVRLGSQAWKALTRHPLRTGLAMLGIVVGVASVVVMLAVGQGSQERVSQVMRSLGSNVLVVATGASTSGGVRQASGTAPSLSLADANAIARLESVRAVAPIAYGTAQLVYGAQNWLAPVQGTTPGFFSVRDWEPAAGQLFADEDVRRGARKAVIGATVADRLFLDEDPIGRTIRIRNVPFTVVATLSRKGESLEGRDFDDVVFVPITTSRRDLYASAFPNRVWRIMVEAPSPEGMAQAESDVRELLRARHRIAPGAEDDFTVRLQDSIYDTEQEAAQAMRGLLATIASVSLLVGGIGIMNIMLVTVTERTREIGLRMAVGARRRDILAQFLLEALAVCVAGGAFGLALGVGAAWIAAEHFALDSIVSLQAGLAAFAASGLTGLFFGLYPASVAARMTPAEALRAE
ncbi:MAG: ABC transporter permease [Quisquiliibacterium sp.]|jgi:putative ABC transport system permease protein